MELQQKFYLFLVLWGDYIFPMKRLTEIEFHCPFNGKPVYVYKQRCSGIQCLAQHPWSTNRIEIDEEDYI